MRAEHVPLVRMARIRPFDEQPLRPRLEHDRQERVERHVVMVRALVVAPADVHSHAIRGYVAQRVIQRFHP